MTSHVLSLEDLIRSSTRALVIGVGGGGDVVGALATARFLEFCGLEFFLGGLSWERSVFDPLPGPRFLNEVRDVRPLHPYVWLANAQSRTFTGVPFAEARMAGISGRDVLLVDINGGVKGVVEGLEVALRELQADLLVGVDVGGDSLAEGGEPGLRSPLADSVMLAAYAEFERRGRRTLWGVFGYGSDGEVPTEASAVPVECARGAWGEKRIRQDQRRVKLTPLTTLTFFLSPTVVYHTLSTPARAVNGTSSLEEANEALHAIGIKTELDLEREKYRAQKK